MIDAGVNTRQEWDSLTYDIIEPLLSNGGLSDIVYPFCNAWERENPQEYKKACEFLDITDSDYGDMTEAEQEAVVQRWKDATYHCKQTIELPLKGDSHE